MNAVLTRRAAIGAATIGTIVIASASSCAPRRISPGLAAALEKYRAADRQRQSFLRDVFDPAEDAWQQAGEVVSRSDAASNDSSAVAAHLAASRRMDSLEERRDELFDLADRAAAVVITYPVVSLHDLQAKMEFLGDDGSWEMLAAQEALVADVRRLAGAIS